MAITPIKFIFRPLLQEAMLQCGIAMDLEGFFANEASRLNIFQFEFEFCCSGKIVYFLVNGEKTLNNHACIFCLFHSEFKLGICEPSIGQGVPGHPFFENRFRLIIIGQNFLHVDIFEPKLVDTWEEAGCPFENISSMVQEPPLNFDFGIFDISYVGVWIDVKGPFENGAGALVFAHLELPFSVLDPGRHSEALSPNLFLELLSLFFLVACYFFLAYKWLDWDSHITFFRYLILANNLLSGDLKFTWLQIAYFRNLHFDHGSFFIEFDFFLQFFLFFFHLLYILIELNNGWFKE